MKICELQSQMMLRHSSRKSSGGHFSSKTNPSGSFSSNNGQRFILISEVSTTLHHMNVAYARLAKKLIGMPAKLWLVKVS